MARGKPRRIARRDADLMEAAGPRGTGAEGVSPVPALYGSACTVREALKVLVVMAADNLGDLPAIIEAQRTDAVNSEGCATRLGAHQQGAVLSGLNRADARQLADAAIDQE